MSRIIVPVACHFTAPDQLCATTVARMCGALELLTPGDILLLSGDVPYAPEGSTLGGLMHEWFVQNGIPTTSLCVVRGGVGTFSEAREICAVAPYVGTQEIVVVSSDWYVFAGKAIWRRRAKEHNLTISFVSVPHTGGMQTRLLYGIIGIVLRSGIAVGLEKPLEQLFTSVQKKRVEGFTFDGCA